VTDTSASNKTVIGVFDDYSTAEGAVRDLAASDVPRESIQIHSNFKTGAAGRGGASESEEPRKPGFFHRLFGLSDDSGDFDEAVRRGSTVVSATVPENRVEDVVRILKDAGAIDIDRRVEDYRRTGYKNFDPKAPAYSSDEVARERSTYKNAGTGTTIPVVEEELQVGKRAVQRGGVRVYSHIVERPVEENIQLTEEHVHVERRPVDRPLNPADTSRLRDQTIEVTETSEEPVVQKRARVREEVVVGKETTQRTEQVRDTVRHTEVKVEPLGAAGGQNTVQTSGTGEFSADFRKNYESNYTKSGLEYAVIEPAYEFGYRMAATSGYTGRKWGDVEDQLKVEYMHAAPEVSWERAKDAIRYGWEKGSGRK
jgi:uncharacterized protein (TIGR02271 family)